MFSYDFSFHRADTISRAVSLLRDLPDAKLLAGGQTLIQAMKLRLTAPTDLIDLGGINALRGVDLTNNCITVGALTRHAEVSRSDLIRQHIPALAHLASLIGDRQVRNLGTIGGSLANNDPAADYPAAILGLDASIRTSERVIGASDFFLGLFETALTPTEVIVSVSFQIPQRAGYIKFRSPASGFALVGAFVASFEDRVRVSFTGAGPKVFRDFAMESALERSFVPSSIADDGIDAISLNSDLHASAMYRSKLMPVAARRAVDLSLQARGPI